MKMNKLKYSNKDLSPIMSEETLKYHKDGLAKSYFKNFNDDVGDKSFNEAGAFLHNIFFTQFKKYSGSNKPSGRFVDLVSEKFGSFDQFKSEVESVAMSIQGSGWIYINSKGDIKTIKNHAIKKDIILLIDWWEHAWALDYQQDKKKYLKNIWKIIDWDYINSLLINKKSRLEKLSLLYKKSKGALS